ncbi:MAG: acylphosphatase [Thermoplasmata archaeon]
MRSKLILAGTVQGVGFRAIVKQFALNADIRGRVRNLSEEGTVEIYCEYRDLDKLTNFIESLRALKTESGLKVESIEQFDEGSEQYGTVDEKIFKGFSVYYGDNLTDYQIDQSERSEFTVFYGMQMYTSMIRGFDNLGNKIDNLGDRLGDKIDNLGDRLGDKIDSMHTDMNTRFDTLDEKYGLISQTMLKLLEQQQEHNKKLDEILEMLTKRSVKRK